MIRRPPRATRTDTLFPSTTLFRSALNFHGFTKGARHRRSAFAESDDRRLQPITIRAGNDARGRLRFHINAIDAAIEGDPPKIRRKRPIGGDEERYTAIAFPQQLRIAAPTPEERRVGKKRCSTL